MDANGPIPSSILEALRNLEMRVSNLEARLEPGARVTGASAGAEAAAGAVAPSGESLEFRIGERYFAQAGIIAVIVGVGFLVTYLYTVLPPPASSLVVGLLTAGTFVLAALAGRFYPQIQLTVTTGGMLLLFYFAVRLAFLGPAPLIGDRITGLAVMAGAVAVQAAAAIRWRSQFFGVLAILCGCAGALIADGTHSSLTAVVLVSALAAYFRLRHDWDAAVVIALCASVSTLLLWIMGNPFLGRPISLRPDAIAAIPYLGACTLLYAGANLFRSRALSLEVSNIILSLLNAVCFYLLGLLVVHALRESEAALFNITAAGVLLGIAVAYWLLRRSFYSASFYSLGGFFALSMAILLQFKGAERFGLLSWQSILVIAMAIWIRSRILTVGNLGIYMGLYFVYHALEAPVAWIDLNHALVAILSARLLNIMKGQLDFKTGFLRNAYLVATFCILPYGLALAVPSHFVSIAWVGASVFYFAMSFLLGNQKYRWMGILNFLLVLGWVLFVDLGSLEPIYRIVSFVAVGVVLLVVSILYAKRARGGGAGSPGSAAPAAP